MDELYISEIYIYPIKSLGGISLKQANVENKGLQYDRRWMLIDDEGTFVSQRKHTSLALLQVEIQDDLVLVYEKENPLKRISFPLSEHINKAISVSIWDDETIGFEVNTSVSKWFSQYLKMPVRLILMSEQTMRNVDERYALNNEVVSFADGYPNLIIGQASLNLLNEKLYEPIPMNRFRPNFVFTGGLPHSE
ncbi:MAG: MOSC domain-containing protein, partial [Chitinophagaceae bacterium]